jgi:glycosyltransferase involved in cell wall biosynthesis
MKIAVNTRLLMKDKLEGIGWFSNETLKRIAQQHPEHQFYFFFDRPYDRAFVFSGNITPFVLWPPARHPFLFFLWFEISVRWKLYRLQPDVFLSPDGYLSLCTSVKSIGVIHDLNFEHYPGDVPFLVRLYYKFFFPRFARKADRIATVSAFSKNDIVEKYGILPNKIDVVYNGVNELFAPVSDDEIQPIRNEFSLGKPYFLYVGAMHPRKNIANLLRAFDGFKSRSGSDMKLLLVGQKKWWTRDINEAYEALLFKDDVIFTGRLSSENLRNVIAAAFALTYVSYFEGFGIPIVEAMACGVPVITADKTAMPEISAGAAFLVDPFSVTSIQEAMVKIHEDKDFRLQLIEKGRSVSKKFTWQKTSEALWACIMKTLE